MRNPLRSTLARFALVSLLPILALGWFLNSTVRHAIESRTAQVYGGMTNVLFRMAADVIASPDDLASGKPLPPERAAVVDELIKRLGGRPETVRVQMVARDGRVVYANRATEVRDRAASSKSLSAALAGETATLFVKGRSPDGSPRNMIEIYLPIRFAGDRTVHGAVIASGLDGSLITNIDRDVRRMQISLAVGLVGLWLALVPIAASVSRRLRKNSEENEFLALHDALTGLPNRNLLADRLQQAIAGTTRTGESVGLLLLDLDAFKEVNDTLGHGKGDALLQKVADRLTASVRATDTVARLGGDEFAIVVGGVTDAEQIADVADRVGRELSGSIPIDLIDVAIHASIGAALYPEHADDAEQLLQHADIAMYAAKASRDGYALYSAEIDSHSPSRLALAADLGRALDGDGQIVLHYQPVASPLTDKVEAMEALVRWHHPTRGLLYPLDFVPMAEQSGLIRKLSIKVLDIALAQLREWIDSEVDVTMAVNLSAADLRSMATFDVVKEALDRHDIAPHMLELEVTETGVLANPETAVELVGALRSLGVRIALDDFGTGYSSLTYLKRLNPDRLKIDRSFVDAMVHEPTDAEIVRSLIDLAHSLAMGVTAEGVETEAHWCLLRDLACDQVQGYYLARPLAPAPATEWLAARPSLARA